MIHDDDGDDDDDDDDDDDAVPTFNNAVANMHFYICLCMFTAIFDVFVIDF